MPDTRLILHVAGTDAQTQELPKEAVKTAIAHGDLSYSQLIWSPDQQSWKQVRELPELLPAADGDPPREGHRIADPRDAPAGRAEGRLARGDHPLAAHLERARQRVEAAARAAPTSRPRPPQPRRYRSRFPCPSPRCRPRPPHRSLNPPPHRPWSLPSPRPRPPPGRSPKPEERLILHVKGTESDTRELPREQVRKAISRGEKSPIRS
ncbi:MAG: hypothetical protein WDO13_19980 [Verrucomicrobiota bacterium]